MALDQLERMLAQFAVLDPQMPLHFLRVFLVVARAEGGSCTGWASSEPSRAPSGALLTTTTTKPCQEQFAAPLRGGSLT